MRQFANILDLRGGIGFEQEKDHVVAGHLYRADVRRRASAPLALGRALREALGGALHPLLIEVWPEALDQERCGPR
jgi:hypothetical protein